MANLIEQAKKQGEELLKRSLALACDKGLVPDGAELKGSVSISKGFGDFAANHAMATAGIVRMNPRELAEILTENIDFEGSMFSKAEVAGKGFINFTLSQLWYGQVLRCISDEGRDYGSVADGGGEKVMIEFVSANPTGPMTIGNARGGVLGDALASVMKKAGYDVWREFYVNDEGNQVELFAQSIEARYIQLIKGRDAIEFPDNGYHGDDIKDLARALYERDGDKYLSMPVQERRAAIAKFALPHNIELMKQHLERYRIHYDCWFLESSLHRDGYVEDTVNLLTREGYTYEKDGALWLKNTALGADKDEALRRANGFYTYYAVDIAYHRDKFVRRNFSRVIDVWGADHHGHAIRFKATMSAPGLGLEGRKLDFLIMQMVRLVRGDETVKVSKRTGKALTLNDLLDEIGVDACRFFFNAKPDSHLEFDLDLAIRQDSENPVYYVQYAHARICSLIETLAGEGFTVSEAADMSQLKAVQEQQLIKQLAAFPEEISLAARDYDPSKINRYVIDVAAAFHRFYNACRIKGEAAPLLMARLKLADCTRIVIAEALSIIGVSAPEKM